MKKYLLLISLIIFTLSVKTSFADSDQINASVLPSVWYSSANINDQDLIKIFGAVQNHSDVDFSGVISIFVDDQTNSKVSFTSKQDSLTEISGPWKALVGKHSVQLVITKISLDSGTASTTFSTSSLLSFESEKTSLSISKPITLQSVEQNVQQIAQNTLENINTAANNLADSIETLKKPETNNVKAVNQNNTASQNKVATDAATKNDTKMVGKVLGAETKYQTSSTNSGIFKYPLVTTIYNKIIDFLSIIVRNWQITLFVIIILFLIIRYFIL